MSSQRQGFAPPNSNPPVPVPGFTPPSFSYNISQSALHFSANQQFHSTSDASASVPQATALSSAPIVSHSSSTSTKTTSLSSPSFLVPPGLAGTPGPAGSVSCGPMILPPVTVDSATSSVQRPVMPTVTHASNPVVQQQSYHTYPSLPAMAASAQGLWFHPPQMGGMPRTPFLPYPPAVFPGSYPLPAHGISRPSISSPDFQPSGAPPVGIPGANPPSSAASGHQLMGTPGMQKEIPPPGIDNRSQIHDFGTKNNAATSDSLDAWTAHKTDAGVVYYYNAVTGVSTYEKPPGFKSEPEKVPMQPTPVSMENLAGTDWALITTNDGKNYYYNNKTKLSSWQIPSEVTELKKKQEAELKEQEMSVSSSSVLNEKGSVQISLSAPAINTGGRDATALRASNALGASSALDLIKKKLQDSGTPVTSSPAPVSLGITTPESNGSRAMEATSKGLPSENSKEKLKDANGDANASDSSSDSEEEDNGPTKEECIIQFKDMLKERGIAPFSKWEKVLPKIVFDPRFQAIPSHSARRSLFEHYVKTRAEEERKEKRAAQKAAIEGFRQLLEEASEEIDHNTDYQSFRRKWGNDPRFEAVDRKDREHLLHERVLPLKKAAQEKAQAERAAAAASFKSMLQDKGDLTVNSRWSKVKESLRNDPRYKSVKHEEREVLFNEYLSELKAAEEEAEWKAKVKREEQEKLKERERELRKRKEREEQEMERVREKVRRKEAVASFQALLVETIKDPQASWTESKTRLEKDPQGRGTNPNLDPSDTEKLFREHVKMLHERCTNEFKALLAEVINAEAASQKTEDGKTVLDSWTTAKRVLKLDPRYNKMPRKEREVLWRRHAEDMLRKQKTTLDEKEDKHTDPRGRSSTTDSGRHLSGSKRTHDRR
ncbi:Pre-mRNA-processing protein PRP40, putative [Ricinus communis]|uniref:Pre-mRNA-processing protein PRP40, putative n=2 Tax=Ricinus communis TaxID=3988 RepID=B9RPX6_RICCO|nr:Pre-mRNA-processing protein PRP40, putative [Ricinus communis]|eukprot:XP_002515795.1 pre-mRNA-processing protein 40C isoform X1 [Ricinus communis]